MEKKTSKKSRFYICYAVFCAVLVFTMSCGIGIFYDFIREYEQSLPEHIAESYIDSLDGAKFSDIVTPEIASRASGFETDDSIGTMLADAIGEGVTFAECIGEDNPAYDVYCGGRFMKLTLTKTSGGKYGFSRYTIASTEIYPEWIENRFSTITVIIPEDASLSLNGKPVSSEYLTEERYESASLTAFDRVNSSLAAYKITDIFGNADVSGEYHGESLSMTKLGENSYYSDFDISSRFDYTVKAPTDAKVTLNGITVTSDYITGSEEKTSICSEFDKATPKLSLYAIPGLLDIPEVDVTLDGSVLSPIESDGTHSSYDYPDSYKRSYTVRVPRGMTLFCNGIEVGHEYVTEENVAYDKPTSAVGISVSARYDVYTVGLFCDPEFKVSGENAAVEADGFNFMFFPVPSSSESKEIHNMAQIFTELFVKYSYEGSKYVRSNYDNCMKYVLSGSDADALITATLTSMIYNSNFKVDKLETKIYGLVKYSDDCISVKVDFESHGKYYRYEKSADGTYTMLWIKRGGTWRLAGFTM